MHFDILTSDKRTENMFILSGSFSKQFGSKQREYQKFLPPEFFLFWQFPVSERDHSKAQMFAVSANPFKPIFLGQWLGRAREWQLTEIEFGRLFK